MFKVAINREFKWGLKGSDDVLNFIERFRTHEKGGIADEVLATQFSCGYCYYFAVILKAAFNRGEVCWCAPYSHFCWVDDDGTPYDIYGLCDSEAEYFIPYTFLGDCLNDFLHIEKDHNTTEEEIQSIIDNYTKSKED